MLLGRGVLQTIGKEEEEVVVVVVEEAAAETLCLRPLGLLGRLHGEGRRLPSQVLVHHRTQRRTSSSTRRRSSSRGPGSSRGQALVVVVRVHRRTRLTRARRFSVREPPLCQRFFSGARSFTQTGSGQTRAKLERRRWGCYCCFRAGIDGAEGRLAKWSLGGAKLSELTTLAQVCVWETRTD